MATIDFTYDYPYAGNGDKGRFQSEWASSNTKVNGSYVYPMVFNETVPNCSHIKIAVEIENTGSGSVYGKKWELQVYRKGYGWREVTTFTLPENGICTVECDVPGYDITKYVFVPSTNPGTSCTWNAWYEVEKLTITEEVELKELETGNFQYGVFVNRGGIKEQLNEVYVNVNGTLKSATDILINVNGELKQIQPVLSTHHISDTDYTVLVPFQPQQDGVYKIKRKKISGDHELRIYNSDFSMLYEKYFYDMSFELIAGALYYISITHYYGEDEESESYLQIYREE